MFKIMFSNQNLTSSSLFLGLLTVYDVYSDFPIDIMVMLIFFLFFLILNAFSIKKDNDHK
ncbi:hypothetical protein [Rummeliibacillus suwonensis]|uniref:hypothetical protein n=1 Tax=Rummeliibacillus suwonensis TaxID=1306154 RepID=UPI001AAE6086|nr:hypothetical protein [Rummeliibacillus suwonensis]MBO2537599.1 hypothetical protein [Rummeliibacillus suwonensis]